MGTQFSLDDVARLTGERVDVVREWQEARLLPAAPFDLRTVERAHLVRALSRRGLSYDVIREAFETHGDMVETFFDQIVPTIDDAVSVQHVSAVLGVDAEIVERVLDAIGIDSGVPLS